MDNHDPSHESKADKLSALQIRYQIKLESMIADIQSSWKGMEIPSDWTKGVEEKIKEFVFLTHKITGSAGTFGFLGVSQSAGPLELLFKGMLEAKTLEDSERVSQINCLVEELKGAFESNLTVSSMAKGISQKIIKKNNEVFIVYSDEAEAIELGRVVGHFGYEITLFFDLEEARQRLKATDELPLAIILGLESKEDNKDRLDFMKRYGDVIPFLVLSNADDFETRLKVVQSGGGNFLSIPFEAAEVLEWLESADNDHLKDPYKVLIVDDDEYLAQSFVLSLEISGIEATILSDPNAILDVLSEEQPDVILMDIYMPKCSGIDLAKIIRQQKQFMGIPIMFLSVESEVTRQYRALLFGGDDFLTKPITADQLVLAVTTRAARARTLKGKMEKDGLTGLLNHAVFKERLNLEVTRAVRDSENLSLGFVDLDYFKSVNDTYGHQAGDKVLKTLSGLLKRRLRKTDILGRYGGEEFGVIMPNTDVIQAANVLEDLRQSFEVLNHRHGGHVFQVTFSSGISHVTEKSSGESMIEIADQKLYQAKEKGRNKVEY